MFIVPGPISIRLLGQKKKASRSAGGGGDNDDDSNANTTEGEGGHESSDNEQPVRSYYSALTVLIFHD
jgi:hypothetical protein